jgi:hypothetical protein
MAAVDRTRSVGRITIRRYDAEALRTALPQWNDLPKKQRLAAVSLLSPESATTTTNIPKKGQHQLLASYLCRAESSTETATHLAVGDDNSTSPTYTGGMNNEQYRTEITDSSKNDTTAVSTTYLDATEANSMDAVREVALVTSETPGADNEYWLNHSLVDPEPKSSTVALTITVELDWEVPQ